MKKIALMLIVLSIASMTSAQTIFDSYMKRVPALPKDSCNISKANADSFVEQVSALIDELTNEIEERNRSADDYAEANRGNMEENAMNQVQQQYGISDEDINKMKNSKDMTDAEKQAMANKMVMQQTNMSMDEIQKMSKMSEAGKKAYAEAYATESMADAQANPKKYAPDKNATSLYSLTNEQQTLNQKITAGQQKIGNMYAAIENDPEGKAMLDKISKWSAKLGSMMGEVSDYEAHVMDSVGGLITKEEIKYCNKFTPRYRAVLKQDLANLKASVADCNRLDEVTGELMKLQTGVDAPPEIAEASSLGILKAYLGHLKDAYKYKLYYAEDN
jgi:chemotaxis protein histidine kinase CheA